MHEVSKGLAAILLDRTGLAYCFGQATERGHEFTDGAKIDFTNGIEVEMMLELGFLRAHGLPVIDWVAHCIPLTHEEARQLVSDLHAKKAAAKTSKRLTRLRALNPEVFELRDKFASYCDRPIGQTGA